MRQKIEQNDRPAMIVTGPKEGKPASFLNYLLVVIVYTTITAAWTYPLLQKISVSMLGHGGDRYIYYWNYWWFGQAVMNSDFNLMFTPLLYYPMGTHLAFHSLTLFNGLVANMLQFFFNPLETYNLIFFLTYPIAGLTTFMLGRDFGLSVRSSFVSGLVYAFWAGHWAHFEHMNQASIQYIPLYVLFLRRWLWSGDTTNYGLRQRIVSSALAGIVWMINAFCNWYYAFYLFFLTIIFVMQHVTHTVIFVRTGKGRSLYHFVLTCVAFSMGVCVIIGPLYAPIISHLLQPGTVTSAVLMNNASAFLETIFLPNVTHPVYGQLLDRVYQKLTIPSVVGFHGCLFLGFGPMALGIIGFLTTRTKEKWLWLVVFVFFLVVSLGPTLIWMGRDLGITLPALYISKLPLMSFLRAPSRFIIVSMIALAIFAGQGSQYLLSRMGRRSGQVILVALCALILFDYVRFPTFMTPPDQVPGTYKRIADLETDRAILVFSDQDHEARKSLYFQTFHHKRITLGFTSHLTGQALGTFNLYSIIDPLFRQKQPPPLSITGQDDDNDDEALVLMSAQGYLPQILDEYKIGWVTLYPHFWVSSFARNKKVLDRELGGPIETDLSNWIFIYEVPPAHNDKSFLFLGKGVKTIDQESGALLCLDGATFIIINRNNWSGMQMCFTLQSDIAPFSLVLDVSGKRIKPDASAVQSGNYIFDVPLLSGINNCEIRLIQENNSLFSRIVNRWLGARIPYQPDTTDFRIDNVRFHFQQ